MGINTFEIKQEYLALESLLNEVDEETGEFLNSSNDIQEYIEQLDATRDEKLINIERYKRDIKGQVDTVSNEIKRLQGLKKSYENQVERLTDLEMTLTDGQKIDTGFYKFSTRKSKQVEIIDIDMIEDKYIKFKKEADKTAIKKAMEEASRKGESFLGANLIEKVSLTVR